MIELSRATSNAIPQSDPQFTERNPPCTSEGEGAGLLTGTGARSDNPRPTLPPPATSKSRPSLPVAIGITGAILSIIAISIWALQTSRPAKGPHEIAGEPSAANGTLRPSSTTPQKLPSTAREGHIRQWSRRAPRWALTLYDVPVPTVRMPPYSPAVSDGASLHTSSSYISGACPEVRLAELVWYLICRALGLKPWGPMPWESLSKPFGCRKQ